MSLCRYNTSKPCENREIVHKSSRTCLDCVLDRIKEEILLLSDSECNGNSVTLYSWTGMQKKVFDIIDKYKEGESE